MLLAENADYKMICNNRGYTKSVILTFDVASFQKISKNHFLVMSSIRPARSNSGFGLGGKWWSVYIRFGLSSHRDVLWPKMPHRRGVVGQRLSNANWRKYAFLKFEQSGTSLLFQCRPFPYYEF